MSTVPVCPKCGEPARVIIIERARVRCALNEDGEPGKVLSATRGTESLVGYECGMPHTWTEHEGPIPSVKLLFDSHMPTHPNPFPNGVTVEWIKGRGWVPCK